VRGTAVAAVPEPAGTSGAATKEEGLTVLVAEPPGPARERGDLDGDEKGESAPGDVLVR